MIQSKVLPRFDLSPAALVAVLGAALLGAPLLGGCASSEDDEAHHRHAVVRHGVVGHDGSGPAVSELSPGVFQLRVDDQLQAGEGHWAGDQLRAAESLARGQAPQWRVARSNGDGTPLQLFDALRVRQASHEHGPKLGVTLERTPDGLKVSEVSPDSLAQAAGVLAGDVLLRVGERRIHDFADVGQGLQAFTPGEEVVVAVIRSGQGIVELRAPLPEPKPRPTPNGRWSAQPDGAQGGFLGVELGPDPGDEAIAPPAEPGVLVRGVLPESAAWYAGLEEGDRLLSLDDKPLNSAEDLVGAVSAKAPGTLVALRYLRDESEHTTSVRLGHRNPLGMSGLQGLRMAPGEFSQDAFGDARDMRHFMTMPRARGPSGQGGAFSFTMPPMGLSPDGRTGRSLSVEILDGEMTLRRDGIVERYRNENGTWVRIDSMDDAGPADDAPLAPVPGTTEGPRPREL